MTSVPHPHTVGIGAGPANLSLAALFDALAPDEIALYERQPAPAWHGGMLHPGVRMQTGWVKDLVSLVDPTHRLSFLNYLVCTGRMFAMLGAGFETVPRLEYTTYLAWAAGQLPRLHYGTAIDTVRYDDGFACYRGDELVTRAENLVLGQGTVPYLPPFLCTGARVTLADDLAGALDKLPTDRDAPIVVAGSGQTSAECVQLLLGFGCERVIWLGRRTWFAPLEDSPTANDLYRPAYRRFFMGLSGDVRRRLADEQVLTSDGISPGTLRGIYQANYEQCLRTGRYPVTIMPGRDIVGALARPDGIELRCHTASGEERHHAAHVVVALGRRSTPLPFDSELMEMVDWSSPGQPTVENDCSIRWKHADRHRIFAANRGRYAHGLADANLSLLPVRAAIIINSLADRTVFDIRDGSVSTVWA